MSPEQKTPLPPRFDRSRDWRHEMHDVFIVISESGEGEHNARTGACHEAVARLRALVYLQPLKGE